MANQAVLGGLKRIIKTVLGGKPNPRSTTEKIGKNLTSSIDQINKRGLGNKPILDKVPILKKKKIKGAKGINQR